MKAHSNIGIEIDNIRLLRQLGLLVAIAVLFLGVAANLDAKTKKGDKFLKQGRTAQLEEDWDLALTLYEQALAEDPADATYQMGVRRARFQAAQGHVKAGQQLRKAGKIKEAMTEFQKALAMDPSSTVAEQEIRTTHPMLEKIEKDAEEGKKPDEEAFLTPTEQAKKDADDRMLSLETVPILKPISPRLNTLKMNNQPAKVLYETVGKLAGINVVFDPEFQADNKKLNVDLTNASLQEALRYVSVMTKTYWKPLSENTIFVTNDNVTKRRDHEEMVVRVFYLENVTKVQELQEIATAVRSVTDIRRLFTYNSQNAILVRGSADQVALAEKLLADLDKPLAEVMIDIIVMEANKTRTRDLAASIQSQGSAGISLPIVWNPAGLPGTSNGDDSGSGSSSGGFIQLGQLGSISKNDWSTSLPGALLSALMSDRQTRILQRPQLRAADGQKASLRLGDRIPYATGSFQPGVGAVGVSPLVSTQFQYADTGVNVDLTPKIHGQGDVSLHLEIEISAVRERIDVGGIEQPVIGQRKVAEDIRVKDGEVTLLGGLTQDQATDTKGGVPGLNDIPIIKWLGFNSESQEHSQGELLIAIIPNVVRRPEISEINLRGIAAGSDQVVQVNYSPKEEDDEIPEAPAVLAPPAPASPTAEAESVAPSPDTVETPEPAIPAGAGVALMFAPGAVTVKTGDQFSVSLMLENGTDIFNAPMKFQFDPALLRMNEVVKGRMLEADGQQVIFTRNILNDAGTASIVLNRLPGAGGISGNGTLVTLTFQAVAAGATRITIPDVTVRDSKMQGVAVTPPALAVTIE